MAPTLYPKRTIKRGGKGKKGGLPAILEQLISKAYSFYSHPEAYAELNSVNNSERQVRSEGRESIIQVMAAIGLSTDLTTMLIGNPSADGFYNFSWEQVREKTHLTKNRFDRAIGKIIRKGFVKTTQARQRQPDGSWLTYVAVKKVSISLFVELGIDIKLLKKESAKSSQRLNKKRESWRDRFGRRVSLANVVSFPSKPKTAEKEAAEIKPPPSPIPNREAPPDIGKSIEARLKRIKSQFE